MLPSKEVLEKVSLLIGIFSGVVTFLPYLIKKLSFLRRPLFVHLFSAVTFCSFGFYAAYLHYERSWVLTNHVQGQVYDFNAKQAARKNWCQWMMDAQDTTNPQRDGLVVFEQFPWKDFLFEGKGRPRVGFLSAQDGPYPEEPPGRMAVAIYDYELGRFPKSSKAELTLRVSKYTTDIPPRIAVIVNDHEVKTIKLDKQLTEYSIDFESRHLEWYNSIYLEPSFDDMPSGKSKLVYLDSLAISTY